MENHAVREHGISSKRNYKEVKTKPPIQRDIFVKKRGQTSCFQCGKSYNNRSKPLTCICGINLNSCKGEEKIISFLLKDDIFSVRKNVKGINKRVIVNRASNTCFSVDCLEARAHFDNIMRFQCAHLKACSEVTKIKKAEEVKIDLEEIKKYIKCDKTLSEIRRVLDVNNRITLYLLPDGNLVMPVLNHASYECHSGLIHLDINCLKCPIKKCSMKPRYHYHVKTNLMCIHVFLSKLVKNKSNPSSILKVVRSLPSLSPQFSKTKTVTVILKKVKQHVPSALHIELEKEFLQRSFVLQQNLLTCPDLSSFEAKICEFCGKVSTLRKRKNHTGLLVTPGFMVEAQINTYVCKTCNIILYPDMFKEGFVPVCENLLVTWSYIVEGRNQVKNGTKLYNFFSSSLRRLCLENINLAPRIAQFDFHNMIVRLTKMTVAYNSVTLLQSNNGLDSLSSVLCLHCGLFPITLMSDGNAKNSVLLKSNCDNLVFDRDDDAAILELDSFVMTCATSVAGSGLFQHFPKEKINVYKIPPIIGNKLIGKVNNREHLKKSAFHEEFNLSGVDFTKMEKLVSSGEIDLLKSRTLPLEKLRKIAKDLNIPKSSKQSKIMIENVLLELFDWLIGGNSNCHIYTHSVGETGGWSDQWCPHNIKYGSKKMVFQESVVDPADLYLSLMYPPLLLILDDPCTFIAHLFCSETYLANTLFGANRGCFEPPHSTDPPKTDHDCPELLPVSIYPRKPNIEVLNNPDSKLHPFSQTASRKVLGTRLSDSHKSRNQCLYHSVGNCMQGSHIKVSLVYSGTILRIILNKCACLCTM